MPGSRRIQARSSFCFDCFKVLSTLAVEKGKLSTLEDLLEVKPEDPPLSEFSADAAVVEGQLKTCSPEISEKIQEEKT